MHYIKLFSAIATIGALLNGAALASDAGGDLNTLLREYRDAEQKSRSSAALHRTPEGLVYDTEGAVQAIEIRRRANRDARTKLDKLNFAGLKPQDKLSYEIFRWGLDEEQAELQPDIAEISGLLPLNQFDGEQISFPRRMQWRPNTPWIHASDYDDAIRRILNFADWAEGAIARMREGVKRGVVQPRAIVQREIAQVQTFAGSDAEQSIFMEPLTKLPPAIQGQDRGRVTDAYHAAVKDELIPAYRRLLTFLQTEYLPHATQTPGISTVPGGKNLYLYLVRSETTSNLSPDEIHALGLRELSHIESRMEDAKQQAGFTGTLDAFRHYLQTDPKFKFRDSAAMVAEFNRIKDAVAAQLPNFFTKAPTIPLSFRVYEDFVAPDKPAAEYTPGSADGKRPGVVYLNAWDLTERPTYTTEALEMHEGIPGHHLQVSLAIQNSSLPLFRRFGEETAFVEGWALYAETLGPEFGLYKDPYQTFGALSFDAWRASRLVVDTGIHWLDWSREQAIQFLTAHTMLSRTEAEEEVDRYIVLPGQALSYKIGEEAILDLRGRAQAALGLKFDLKRFHEALLSDGAMPLPILERKMARWIELQRAS